MQLSISDNLAYEDDLPLILSFSFSRSTASKGGITYSSLGEQKSVHDELRKEVREKLANNVLSFETVQQMELVFSFVYETLRLNPPVPSQFGRARKDFELSSHDAVFQIKKGEMLCGYQPLVMQDPKIFENPEDFVYNRFTKEKGGEKLLKYLFWSNGPQSGANGPSASNKQCPARDVVPMTAAAFVSGLLVSEI
ncbi:UNVERIFIED_CONTAM: Fatty acid hydroperoxide lyase, chloroplastic [Sesamum calycinum]|uniref:Fatty acid hydroperoxide lyase, chloroplastic n=1 Tax=Sesamum calycinum TaxID=2727403 RepID=A0AAW2JMG7_9LAMI